MMKTPACIFSLVAVQLAFYLINAQVFVDLNSDAEAKAAVAAASANVQSEEQEQLLASDNCTARFDPLTIHPCGIKPYWLNGDPNIYSFRPIEWHCRFPWWWILKSMKRSAAEKDGMAVKAMARTPGFVLEDDEDESPEDVEAKLNSEQNVRLPFIDWRPFSWHQQCRHRHFNLCSFKHKKYGRCFIVKPWLRRTPYAQCLTRHCDDRCYKYFWRVKNTRCYPSCFESFYRFIYCPQMPTKACTLNKWFCFRWEWIRLPQCCDCYQCWYMGLTRSLKDVSLSAEAKVAMLQGSSDETVVEPTTPSLQPSEEDIARAS